MEKWIYKKKPTEVTPAKGVTGILIFSNGKPVFRVYSDDKESFKDYDLRHQDLKITVDEDAYFYDRDGVSTLDYDPRCLGLIKIPQ